MKPTTYTCSECGASASLKDGEVVRNCEHDAAILAHLSAVATGQSEVK